MTKLPKRSRSNRRPTTHRSRSHNSSGKKTWPKRFFSAALAILLLSATIFGVAWTVGPTLFPLLTAQNILFIPSSLDGKNNQIYFASFSTEDQTISVVPVQDATTVVIGGYGQYRLSAIWSLLKLEKKPAPFIQAALSWSTQTIVDDVITTDQSNGNLIIANKPQLLQALAQELRSRWYQPDQFFSLLKLFFFAKTVPEEQVTIVTEAITLGDLPDWIGPRQSACSIAVVNTTPKSGLATATAKILEQSQLSVLRVTDDPANLPESTINVTTDKQHFCHQLAERLQDIFPTSVKLIDQPELRQEHRAEMVIVLGGDLAALAAW